MKKLMYCILVLAAVAGTVFADECNNNCTYELMEINLTYAFKRELIQSGKPELVANFEENFLPCEIPLYFKRIEFNIIVAGREFKIVEGSLSDDYFVWVKIKNCQ